MTVSIIVAVKKNNPRLEECIENCLKLDYQDFEILVLPDKPVSLNYLKTRVIPTGEVTPPLKRDMAAAQAKGEVLAFLDDDAYPSADWLKNALGYFLEPEIAAVGGPAITPESDTLRQKASGFVYSSPLVSAGYVYRYLPRLKRFVDDYPSCNFLVRKQVFLEAGGFNTKFWPGEDTFFCLKIIRDLKKKIVYDPKVLVYHHRRSLFYGHLKQIANYAMHRGYFVKKFPETSLRPAYFIPSLFVAGLTAGLPISILNPAFKIFYNSAIFFYLAIALIFSLRPALSSQDFFPGRKGGVNADFRLIFLVFWGIIFSHLIYGLFFIRGLFSGKLKEE